MARVHINTTCSAELMAAAKARGLKISECIDRGIQEYLGEKSLRLAYEELNEDHRKLSVKLKTVAARLLRLESPIRDAQGGAP